MLPGISNMRPLSLVCSPQPRLLVRLTVAFTFTGAAMIAPSQVWHFCRNANGACAQIEIRTRLTTYHSSAVGSSKEQQCWNAYGSRNITYIIVGWLNGENLPGGEHLLVRQYSGDIFWAISWVT
jgi:hypothetical protein